MEISCKQCSAEFTVEPGVSRTATLEAVCPSCFQVQTIELPAELQGSLMVAENSVKGKRNPRERSVAEKLREGFTLSLELRHGRWEEPLRLNPFEIKRMIYQGSLDGTEEFSDGRRGWKPIGQAADFALVFRLIGKSVSELKQLNDKGQRRFAGWEGAGSPPLPAAATSARAGVLLAQLEENETPSNHNIFLLLAAIVCLLGAVASFFLF